MQIPPRGIPPGPLSQPISGVQGLHAAHQDFAAHVCRELEETVGMPGGKRAEKGRLQSAKSFPEGSAPMNRVHSRPPTADA